MAKKTWRVRVGRHAAADFIAIIRWTEDRFGSRQAQRYEKLLRAGIRTLRTAPLAPPSRNRDKDLGDGFRTLHVARPGRHLLLYRVESDLVVVARILHDSMDLAQHLPTGDG